MNPANPTVIQALLLTTEQISDDLQGLDDRLTRQDVTIEILAGRILAIQADVGAIKLMLGLILATMSDGRRSKFDQVSGRCLALGDVSASLVDTTVSASITDLVKLADANFRSFYSETWLPSSVPW